MAEDVMAVIIVGYKTYVMPVEEAVAIAKSVATAEMYERKYRSSSEGGTTYHVYQQEEQAEIPITVLPNVLYRMAKMAGKPQ
jgi:hypothetical protein